MNARCIELSQSFLYYICISRQRMRATNPFQLYCCLLNQIAVGFVVPICSANIMSNILLTHSIVFRYGIWSIPNRSDTFADGIFEQSINFLRPDKLFNKIFSMIRAFQLINSLWEKWNFVHCVYALFVHSKCLIMKGKTDDSNRLKGLEQFFCTVFIRFI